MGVERLTLAPEGDGDLRAARGHLQRLLQGAAVVREHPATFGDSQEVGTRARALRNVWKPSGKSYMIVLVLDVRLSSSNC